jgi:hypothetical protein
MFYFTRVHMAFHSKDRAENAIRHFSLKRFTSLDLQSSSSYIREDKYFLGLEGKNDVKIIRLRTPFERLFPGIILSFPKDKQFAVYKIRYSLLSTIIFCFLLIGVLQMIVSLAMDRAHAFDFAPLIIAFLIFIGLTYLEIRLTQRKIQHALNNYFSIEGDK